VRIAASGLVKSFDRRRVLDGVSLEVGAPGVHALVGPNGSGKTTLMRLLALLERPDEGTITYDGDPAGAAETRAAALRRRMALVHNPAVMLSGTVRYNVGYGPMVRRAPSGDRRRLVEELLESMSLGGFGRREARTLSAGEIQRVALARAMAAGPETLFLDEPTANLDPLSARTIEQAIAGLARRGVRIVLATHNLWQVERLADRLWFLNDGRISLSGPAADILHRGDQAFWGRFLGRDNLFSGEVVREAGRAVFRAGSAAFEVVSDLEGKALASLNPNEIILSRGRLASSARNTLAGPVTGMAFEDGVYKVAIDAGIPLIAAVTKASRDELGLDGGVNVFATFKASAVRVWKETE